MIPVLYQDTELPPLLAAHVGVDFRGADGPVYEQRVAELVRRVREQPRPMAAATGVLEPAPGSQVVASGTRRLVLRIGQREVRLIDGARETAHVPAGLDHTARQRIHELWQQYRRGLVQMRAMGNVKVQPAPGDSVLHGKLLEAGSALGRAFLAGEAGEAVDEGGRRCWEDLPASASPVGAVVVALACSRG